MMRQVANDISTQSNSLETALGERDSGMEEAPEEHLSKQWQRCCWGESGNGESSNRKRKCWWPLHITSTSAKEKEDEEVIIFVCTLCHSNHSSRCVDRTYPFLTNDPREPLQIMEECDNTYGCILFQYASSISKNWSNIHIQKDITCIHYSMKATPIRWKGYMTMMTMSASSSQLQQQQNS